MTWVANRYELGDLLGQGGMADVHLATDHLLSRPVAVKVLRDTAENETDRVRFQREARTLAALNHHGLVTILDAGLTGARPFLVMELVRGPSLSRALTHGPMPLERTRAIGHAVAQALAYTHDHGVVHRDIKPGNVLLRTDGAVKLADFGIARMIGDTVRHTRTGHAIGTAAYLAPEQVLGEEITGAADVYALGLVLLESATGQRCYPGPATEAALARLSRPPTVPDTVPPDLRALIEAMTARRPTERPTTAAVAEVLAPSTVPSPPPRRSPPPPPPPRRSPPPPPPPPPADRTRLRMPAAPAAAPTTPTTPVADRIGAVPAEAWAVAGVGVLLVLLLVAAALAG